MSFWFGTAAAHGIAGACAYTALVISIIQILQHLRYYTEPVFQRYIVRIIFLVPMYSLASFPSLVNSENAIYYTTIRDCYEAWVIYNFMSLCLAVVGGPGAVETKMAGYVLMPSWHAWTCCLPPMRVDGHFVRMTKRGAIQFVILKPVLAILTLVLYATGHYEEGNWSPSSSYLYITIVYNITYTLALYALLLFYLGTHELMASFHPLLKFILIKSVIFLTYWQSLFIGIATGAGAIASAENANAIQNWLICVEMLPAGIFMLFAFPWSDYKLQGGGSLHGGNIRHAISIKDVVSDTVHQFAPAYHDYVLYSDGTHKPGSPGAHPKTVRTRTFMAVGQESSGRAAMDASLIMNMELGGVSTWSKQQEGPPAPGHTDEQESEGAGSSSGGAAGAAGAAVAADETVALAGPGPFAASTEEDGLPSSPPVVGKSKYLAQEVEDPFAEEHEGGENGRRKKKGKQKEVTFAEIAL